MRTILVFIGLLCALILPFSEGSTIGLKSDRGFHQSTSFTSDPLLVPQCGISNVQTDRIVGGTEAMLGEFPWIVRLGQITSPMPGLQWISWICGGTLISERHILTAAHCFSDSSLTNFLVNYVVRIGDLDFDSSDDGAHPVEVLIEEIMIHSEYNDISHENDAAVLKTDRKVQFTSMLLPACLPLGNMKNKNLEGEEVSIAGWGNTEYQGSSPHMLLGAKTFLTTQKECKTAYSKLPTAVIDNRTLCAASPGIDSCQGDSGGPLMIRFENKTYVIGIVSWGKGCAEPNYPGVYTKVAEFLSFIKQCIGIEVFLIKN